MKKKYIALVVLILMIFPILSFNYLERYHPVFLRRHFPAANYIFKSADVVENAKQYKRISQDIRNKRVFYYNNSLKKNSQSFLEIPTAYKSTQANHPDVLYFKNGFHGYKYWMACTPYPDSIDKFENPHILVSNDGISFYVPKGLKNPIVNTPNDNMQGGHLSDTDLMYKNNMLILHYVYNKRGVLGPAKFYRVISRDGIKWSSPELIYESKQTVQGYSPAFVAEGKLTKMWFISGEGSFNYVQSKDNEKTWESAKNCNIDLGEWKSWHVDVIKTDKGYEGLMCAKNPGVKTRAVFYIRSTDGINWSSSKYPIIFPTETSWDSAEVYRSTMIKLGNDYKLWYSARSKANKWHIGYIELNEKEIDNLIMNNSNIGKM